jgi:hypothetical protein
MTGEPARPEAGIFRVVAQGKVTIGFLVPLEQVGEGMLRPRPVAGRE